MRYLCAALLAAGLAFGLLPGGEENSLSFKRAPTLHGQSIVARAEALVPAVDSNGLFDVLSTPMVASGGENATVVADLEFQQAEMELLGSGDPELREQALYVLRHHDSESALQLIEATLADPDESVRAAAIDVLAERGDARSAFALIHAYYSETEQLREEIVHALAEINSAGTAQLLLAATRDESAAVRAAALAYIVSD